MPNNAAIPQRTITITVHGDNNDHYMTYSYWSPVTHEQYNNVPKCDLLCNRPTYFLFILDYKSTLNGWTITGITPGENFPPLETTPGPYHLSVANYDPHSDHEVHHFAINYLNTITGISDAVDPQEGNIPGGD